MANSIRVLWTAFLIIQVINCAAVRDEDTSSEDNGVPDGTLNPLNCLKARPVRPNSYVKFFLYTSEHPNPQILDMKNLDAIRKASFMTDSPFKIIIHGYTKNHDLSPNAELRPAYLNSGKYNVISVDYAPLATKGCYITAVQNAPVVANCTAQLIEFLVEQLNIPLKSIHVIGFSLGAQIAGQIANYINVGNISRITGLDPAMPLFYAFEDRKSILDASDAEFVDVIHTNCGVKGKIEASGHVDFYMNGGFRQPGCEKKGSTCDHQRAPIYYAESITTDVGFWGQKCQNLIVEYLDKCDTTTNDLVLMGEFTPESARGIFYIKTNDRPPYAEGR